MDIWGEKIMAQIIIVIGVGAVLVTIYGIQRAAAAV